MIRFIRGPCDSAAGSNGLVGALQFRMDLAILTDPFGQHGINQGRSSAGHGDIAMTGRDSPEENINEEKINNNSERRLCP